MGGTYCGSETANNWFDQNYTDDVPVGAQVEVHSYARLSGEQDKVPWRRIAAASFKGVVTGQPVPSGVQHTTRYESGVMVMSDHPLPVGSEYASVCPAVIRPGTCELLLAGGVRVLIRNTLRLAAADGAERSADQNAATCEPHIYDKIPVSPVEGLRWLAERLDYPAVSAGPGLQPVGIASARAA